MKKDFLSIKDLTQQEIYRVFDLAKCYSTGGVSDPPAVLDGGCVGMLFSKPSTRTRVSFEVAVHQLGGKPIYLQGDTTQVSRGESIRDTAAVLSRYLKGLIIRTYRQEDVEDFARWFRYPVVNALTDLLHPCQALTDFFTIYSIKGGLDGVKITYFGDANNVCNSLILGADLLGVKIRILSPESHSPSPGVLEMMQDRSIIEISSDPAVCIEDTDVIYTDTWISMGEEAERESRTKTFQPYRVDKSVIQRAKKDVIFMHCLPAHRGDEVTDDVLDGPHSVILKQAENRLHCQQALLNLIYSNINEK